MKRFNKVFRFFFCGLMLCLCAVSVNAGEHRPLICSVDETQDDFKVYPNQLVFASETFLYYQLIDGLTVLVVNKKTSRFNRLSNLNLLSSSTMDPSMPPESYQLFSGTCKSAK